ncbi:MAG: Rossmann-like and DUF2520 domain-containing protein [Bacillota bacterium]
MHQHPKVAVIGAGRVGSALALSLTERGYPVAAVASRSAASAERLAAKVGARVCAAAEAAREGELVFVTTPDGVIGTTAAEIAREGGIRGGQYVAHVSGAHPAAILMPAKEAGAVVFSLHPLQSFATPELALERLPGSYFTFEGDRDAYPLARQLVDDLGGSLFQIEAAAKPLYHAAACVASNYLVTLLDLVLVLAGQSGLPRADILPAFLPLIQGTINNVSEVGPIAALTGPVARGDSGTIRQHAAAMGKEEWGLYRLIGLFTVKIAREKGLSPEAAEELQKIFSEVK